MNFSNTELGDLTRRAYLLQEQLQSPETASSFPEPDSELYSRWLNYLHSSQAVHWRYHYLRNNKPKSPHTPIIDGSLLNAILANVTPSTNTRKTATIGTLPLPAFGELLIPFVYTIRQSLEQQSALSPVLSTTVLDTACLSLLQLLCHYSTSVFYLEYRLFHGARSGLLPEHDASGNYQAFSEHLLKGGLKQILWEYPVLTRWLLGACKHFKTMLTELPAIVSALDGKHITRLEMYLSDLHEGRSVYAVALQDGSSWHIKPRHCALEQWLRQWLTHCEKHGFHSGLMLPAMRYLTGYTLAESVPQTPCRDPAEVAIYFERAGSWLCLFRLLHASDLHCANIIASGATPVPVDVETLLQPAVPWSAVLHPLHQTDIIPFPNREPGTPDYSALGRTAGASLPHTQLSVQVQQDGLHLESSTFHLPKYPSLPHWNGHEQSATHHLGSILKGYRTTYDWIRSNSPLLTETTGELSSLSKHQTRYVFRHTGIYNRIQERLLQPECLRDGNLAGVELERLAQRAWNEKDVNETLLSFADAEIRVLSNMDIPAFLSDTDRCRISDVKGNVVATYEGPTPLDRVYTTLSEMSDLNLSRELELVRECFQRNE